jgi:dTDP-4-amino-4,6-dideoxygalactose transaminase
MNVPFMELKTEHEALRGDLRRAWDEALDNAAFIGGASVERFEAAFAKFCEAQHAIGVANGTDAIVLALKAVGVRPGDEVIVPANSFVATAEAIVHAGATPIFVDVDPNTYTIDVNLVEESITPRTKAIAAVHLYGQPAEMKRLCELAARHGIRVIEDAAQAHGARYQGRRAGSLGDAACFSFYPAKNLGACGDGGAVVTNDPAIAEAVRKLRDHGGLRKYQHDVVGYNSRLDSLQASVLHLKLARLEERNAMRRRHAETYSRLLGRLDGIVLPREAEGAMSVYHLYVIRLERGSRDRLQAYLAENGVQTGIHYPTPIHCTQAFSQFRTSGCPIAERNAARILSLPMYPEMTKEQLQHVGHAIGDYMQTCI